MFSGALRNTFRDPRNSPEKSPKSFRAREIFGSFEKRSPGAIIGDGDRNEVSFTIARVSPCEVRFGLFLEQIAPSLQNKKRALHANLRLDLDKLAGPWHFQILVLLANRGKMIYKILMLLLQ